MKNKIYVCKIEKVEDIIKNNKFEKNYLITNYQKKNIL